MREVAVLSLLIPDGTKPSPRAPNEETVRKGPRGEHEAGYRERSQAAR